MNGAVMCSSWTPPPVSDAKWCAEIPLVFGVHSTKNSAYTCMISIFVVHSERNYTNQGIYQISLSPYRKFCVDPMKRPPLPNFCI
jgi:hypothetical protein